MVMRRNSFLLWKPKTSPVLRDIRALIISFIWKCSERRIWNIPLLTNLELNPTMEPLKKYFLTYWKEPKLQSPFCNAERKRSLWITCQESTASHRSTYCMHHWFAQKIICRLDNKIWCILCVVIPSRQKSNPDYQTCTPVLYLLLERSTHCVVWICGSTVGLTSRPNAFYYQWIPIK